MASMSQKFILIGPHTGKTMPVNGHEFVDGEMTFHGSAEQVAVLARVFEYYGAVTEQQAELQELRKVPQKKPTLEEALEEKEEDIPGALSLAEAIGTLDPKDEDHWTSNNLPSLDYLSAVVGKRVGRDDVNAIADGYTRAKARTAKP